MIRPSQIKIVSSKVEQIREFILTTASPMTEPTLHEDLKIIIYGKEDTNNYLFVCLLSLGVCGFLMNVFVYVNLAFTKNLNYHLRILKCLSFTDTIQNVVFIAQICHPTETGLPKGIVGDLLCRVYLSSFLVLTLTAASSWLVVLLSLELYGSSIDFSKPKWYKLMFKTPNRIRLLSLLCWVAGILSVMETIFYFKAENNFCVLPVKKVKFWKYIIAFVQFVFLIVVPLSLVCLSYFKLINRTKEAMIFHRNWRQLAPGSEFNYHQARKMIWTLFKRLAIIVVFHLLAWVPNQLFWWLFISGVVHPDSRLLGNRYDQLIQLSPLMNCALNPILYGWTWFEFRDIMKPRLLKVFPCFRRKPKIQDQKEETNGKTPGEEIYKPPLKDIVNYRPSVTSVI